MDNSFRARVDKIFGSLAPSSQSKQPSTSLQSALWSLSDEAVEKKEWRRDTSSVASFDRDDIPCASSFDDLIKERKRKNFQLEDDLDELDDDHAEDPHRELNWPSKGREDGLDEWEIRSSIGLDCTLDNEEEEDEYDKVAEGRENEDERLYMKNVTGQGSSLNFYNVIPNSTLGARDLRANHLATLAPKIRLQEDQAEARKLNSHHDFDRETKDSVAEASDKHGDQLKSILKRKDSNPDCKSLKRVRFHLGCELVNQEALSEDIQDISSRDSSVSDVVSEGGSKTVQDASGVLDYFWNPSKYIHYSFDSSSEVDERSNTEVYMDFLKQVKYLRPTESGSEQEDASSDLRKSVTFIPKKTSGKAKAIGSGSMVEQDKGRDDNHSRLAMNFPVGIAAGESEESEAGSVAENESEANAIGRNSSFQKPGRRYRTKSSSDDLDP